jgi:hypothetical protein
VRRAALTLTLALAAAVAAGTLAAALPAAAAAQTRIACLTKRGDRIVLLHLPRSCAHFGPGDTFGLGVNLVSLRWRGWGSANARASGIERGFHLPYPHIRAAVHVYRRRGSCRMHGHRYTVYTRLRAVTRYGSTTLRLETCPRRVF